MFSAVKASERARALLVSPANKNMSKQTNYGLKIPIGDSKECKRQAIEFWLKKFKSRFIWLRWLPALQKWFYTKVIAAKSYILGNKLALVMARNLYSLAFKLFACENETGFSHPHRSIPLQWFKFFRIERALISSTWNRGKCGAILASKIGFCCRQLRLVTYATEISLLRSLVPSQQLNKLLSFSR